jgi:UDP-2,4-diacetamido-2,4,6-trideoxy-beta-L-altropyranose hydrolase
VKATGSTPQVTLRRVRSDDAELMREWRNDHDAVRFSVTGRPVTPDEHAAWFARQVDDPARLFWIAEQMGRPAGQVRVDVTGSEGTVSIAVAPEQRRRGIGTSILQAMLSEIVHHPEVRTLTALAHSDNVASVRAFERAGFRHVGQAERKFVRLTWP